MPDLRRFLLVLAVLASVAGFGSARALATPPPGCAITEPEVASSEHFDVYYNADQTKPNFITETQALNIAASAEQAYAAYKAMGFPTPPVDPVSGTTAIQVLDLTPWKLAGQTCYGSFNFNASTVGAENEQYEVGVAVFNQVQLSLFVPAYYEDDFLPQGAAAWASWRALGYPAMSTADIGPFDMSLNCYIDIADTSKCSKNGYDNLGESRWPFYEYLSERFGPLFIKDVLLAAQAANDSLLGIENALTARGTTLTAEYAAFATKLMSGAWSAPSLRVAPVPTSGSPIMTGTATGDIPAQLFNVNHLATRYVEIDRGDGSADHACYAATLTVTVQIPAGVTSQPAFYWNDGGSSVDLAVSGNTATTTVPWDTCRWANKGFVSLPNTTTTVDGKKFSVSARLTVDANTPATSKLPTTPATPFGEVLNVPWSSAVPAISIFGPELLKLSAGAQQIRLIVESSGEGSVAATLGSVGLGSGTLRPGENDLRFVVPQGVLSALRRSAAAGATVLNLTPTSVDGKATGPVVTQQISITPLPTVMPPKKHAPAKKQAPAKKHAAAKKTKAAAKKPRVH
jgi:hypothetical protein